MYLLAKKLPHTLVSGENEKFKKLLAETEAKDIAAFARAVGQQATEIDGKVCAKKKVNAVTGGDPSTEVNEHGRWSCIDYNDGKDHSGGGTHKFSKEPNKAKTLSWRFGEHSKYEQSEDITTSDEAKNLTNRGWPGTAGGNTKTADGMAADLSGLQRPDKAKVAGLLSKTVSGAEVVEIRAVSKFAKSSPNEKRSRLQKQQYNNF